MNFEKVCFKTNRVLEQAQFLIINHFFRIVNFSLNTLLKIAGAMLGGEFSCSRRLTAIVPG
jgi:hypothetical protein